MPVHEGSRPRIGKRLRRHHMAPVAGGIPDGQQNGFVFLLGPRQDFAFPRMPVNRVVGVLEQIGTLAMNEVVGVFTFHRAILSRAEFQIETLVYHLLIETY